MRSTTFAAAGPHGAATKESHHGGRRVLPLLRTALVLAGLSGAAHASQIDIVGPAGSLSFGTRVTVLANGNIVVVDPDGPVAGIGAVYLYGPEGGAPISTITGIAANDHIGSGGIVVLANGNYLILSPAWHNGAAVAGAVTWADAATGVSGLVSPANSLVGSSNGDGVGAAATQITVLANGNYVVVSPRWDDGLTRDAGAVTWGDGDTGISGVVAIGNSLIGGQDNAEVGGGGVVVVGVSNYVVSSPLWDNGGEFDAGAVTWANGATGISGLVSVSNSLVGSLQDDSVGSVTALANGNYVVAAPGWDNGGTTDVGAVTWGNGASGRFGTLSAADSLIGTTDSDAVGEFVTALSNGNYVVGSPGWENAQTAASKVGAATWCSGLGPTAAVVSAANSLIGAAQNDRVASAGALALSNGHYVVQSPDWRNGGVVAGAATWRNGTGPAPGVVAGTNSHVGTSTGDAVGAVAVALSNGHYVLATPSWDSGLNANAGAVTWGNGTGGSFGPLSAANSLVGSKLDDALGTRLIALVGGNFVTSSFTWDNGTTADVGAATFGSGSGGTIGSVSVLNSLIGSAALDRVGRNLLALSNGSYLVGSPDWSNGAALAAVGAVTLGNGATGISGNVLPAGSMTGSQANDQIGNGGLIALPDGKAAILSSAYDDGPTLDVGAVTLVDGPNVLPAAVDPTLSVIGAVASGGITMALPQAVGFDPSRNQLAVGRPASNIVTLLRFVDAVFADGFE